MKTNKTKKNYSIYWKSFYLFLALVEERARPSRLEDQLWLAFWFFRNECFVFVLDDWIAQLKLKAVKLRPAFIAAENCVEMAISCQ
jgi:hypothetical protein